MGELEMQDVINQINGMSQAERRLALSVFKSDELCIEIMTRLSEYEGSFRDMDNVLTALKGMRA